MPDGWLVVPAPTAEFVDGFLGTYDSKLRQLQIIEPDLEAVFLTLTGRDLRDRTDGGRAAERADGRRAGRR